MKGLKELPGVQELFEVVKTEAFKKGQQAEDEETVTFCFYLSPNSMFFHVYIISCIEIVFHVFLVMLMYFTVLSTTCMIVFNKNLSQIIFLIFKYFKIPFTLWLF